MHPLALRGSDVMLWDTVRSEVAPRAGIVVDDDIAFDRSAPNLNGADSTIYPGANKDESEHTAVVVIQRFARGRLDGQKASRRAANERSRAYRKSVHSEAQYAGQEAATAFFRGLLSRSHEVRRDEREKEQLCKRRRICQHQFSAFNNSAFFCGGSFRKNRAEAVVLSESAAFEDTVRTDAACRIQMIVRGELARQRVGRLWASSINGAAVQLQKILRGVEARAMLTAYHRGFICRSDVADMPLEPALAATRIQTTHRRRAACRKTQMKRNGELHRERGWGAACGAAAEAAEVYRTLSIMFQNI